jgi:hypothetical protein
VLWLAAIVAALGLAAGAIYLVSSGGGPSYPDQWDERVADLAAFVEDERDLSFRHPVAVDFLTADEYAARTRLDEDELTDDDRRRLEGDAALLGALGLVADEFDPVESANDLADTGTLAFYDTITDRITVRGTELTVDLRVTLVHELVHALQDQHFDLDQMWDDPGVSGEQLAGFVALLEGDATRVEFAYVDALPGDELDSYFDAADQMYEDAQQELGTVPSVLVALQAAPYALGPSLVELIAADGGNHAIDAAFDDPPATTEHMVDPRSYFEEDRASGVEVPEMPEGAEQIGEDDSLGALGLFLVLSERIDPLLALSAADGWGGDAYVVYDDDGATCVDMAFEGDTRADGQEIRRALDEWVASGPAGSAAVDTEGGLMLTACAPQGGVDQSGDALAALTLPAVRAQIMWAVGSGPAGIDDAFAVGDCFVRAVPLDQLIEAGESAEPAAEVSAAVDKALVECAPG